MSRSGYSDESDDQWASIRWRGAVASAIKGRRGQQMLRELLQALDDMPDKRLVSNVLHVDGSYCALGVLGARRGVDLDALDPDDCESVAAAFGIAPALAAEIVYENDDSLSEHEWIDVVICGPMRDRVDGWRRERHERLARVSRHEVESLRWKHMRAWVAAQIKDAE